MKLIALLIGVLLTLEEANAVAWVNGRSWALSCDFPGKDLKAVKIEGPKCGAECAGTDDCTHFTHRYGVCYMKKDGASKDQAVDINDSSAVCGIIHEIPGIGCDFKFGITYDKHDDDYTAADYLLMWIGFHNFNQDWHGRMLKNTMSLKKMPVYYAYVIAFMGRNEWGLKDCDVGTPNLCQTGANFIRSKRADIVEMYRHYAEETAKIIGRDAVMIWLIEPDFWQYYGLHEQQNGALSGEYMRGLFDDFALAIKSELPNARISWDISAWIGEDGMRRWWGYFASSPHINYIHSSGGRFRADIPEMKPNELRWAFLSSLTGKKIIADTGYGVAGAGMGHTEAWDQLHSLKDRIRDGVMAITQAHPKKDWKYTTAWLRERLPKVC